MAGDVLVNNTGVSFYSFTVLPPCAKPSTEMMRSGKIYRNDSLDTAGCVEEAGCMCY